MRWLFGKRKAAPAGDPPRIRVRICDDDGIRDYDLTVEEFAATDGGRAFVHPRRTSEQGRSPGTPAAPVAG